MTSWVPGAGGRLDHALGLRPDLLQGWHDLLAASGPVPEDARRLAGVLGDDPHAVTDADVDRLVGALGAEGAVRALVAAALADGADRLAALLEVAP